MKGGIKPMTSKVLKILSIVATVGLAGATVLNEVVRDKKINEQIAKEVAKALAKN